jgi:hypothetical protein
MNDGDNEIEEDEEVANTQRVERRFFPMSNHHRELLQARPTVGAYAELEEEGRNNLSDARVFCGGFWQERRSSF